MSIIILFVILGTLGGLTSALIHSKSFPQLLTYSSFKSAMLGSIAGVVYFFLYTNYNFPNSVMVFICGYAAEDFILTLTKEKKGRWSTWVICWAKRKKSSFRLCFKPL